MGNDIFVNGEWYCSAGGEHCADVIATALNEALEENERLMVDNETLRQRNTEFGERLKYVEGQNQFIKNKINDAMENERTHIGYRVLKQLMEDIL